MSRLAISIILVLAGTQPLFSQTTIDVAKITCEQFLLWPDTRSLSIWLNGYYHGRRGDPIVAAERAKANGKKLWSACLVPKNTNVSVMQLIETTEPK
jgi:acid stress chaperone HdeB